MVIMDVTRSVRLFANFKSSGRTKKRLKICPIERKDLEMMKK